LEREADTASNSTKELNVNNIKQDLQQNDKEAHTNTEVVCKNIEQDSDKNRYNILRKKKIYDISKDISNSVKEKQATFSNREQRVKITEAHSTSTLRARFNPVLLSII